MSKSLELRPLPYIAAGYVLGPIVGLTALWLLWIVAELFDQQSPWQHALMMWLFIIAIGGAICLSVELAAVTPLLIGFRRYHWRWLNGWTAVTIGFLAGAAIALILKPLLDYGFYQIAGQRILPWGAAFVVSLLAGMVGAVAALVFRLIAVRTGSNPNPARGS